MKKYTILFIIIAFILGIAICRTRVTEKPSETFSISFSHQKGNRQKALNIYFNDIIITNVDGPIVDAVIEETL